jgi:predicted nucleic acid-binding protein
MIHLDTNIVVAHLRGDRRIAQRLESALPGVGLSTIALAELAYGVHLSARPEENRSGLQDFLQLVDLVDFDPACADAYGTVRTSMRRSGRPAGEADTLIAATAIAYSATLVTHNTRHFEGIDGLAIEDWLT